VTQSHGSTITLATGSTSRRKCDYDSQAAEEHTVIVCFAGLAEGARPVLFVPYPIILSTQSMEISMMPTKLLTRNIQIVCLLGIVLASVLFAPSQSLAWGNNESALPVFSDFSKTVQNGEEDVLRGVYVPSVLALPIVQQPANSPGFVSGRNGEATQFSLAAQNGNVGLLAHNTLSGSSFSKLAIGQEVRLIYGGGRVEYFVITEILQYQALQPTSPWSDFRDMTAADGRTITAQQLFERVYSGPRHITFQTCIEAEGNVSWGRLFVLAKPMSRYFLYNRPAR
jgi:hypothetical protein